MVKSVTRCNNLHQNSLFAGDKDTGETCLHGVTDNGEAIKIQA
jgi:hypothetical protein